MVAITRDALAALAALPPAAAGALVGYGGESGGAVVVGAHASSDPSALAALLPPPLRVLGRIGAGSPAPGDALAAVPPAAPGGAPTFTAPGGGAGIEPEVLDHDPLERDHVLVRCVVDAVLEAAEGAAGAAAAAAALDALEARLCGAGAVFLVDDDAGGGAAVAGAQLLSTLAGSGAPVALRAACRAPAAARPAAPVAAFEPAEGGVATAAARLDALCFAPRGGTAAEAGALARSALAAQLAAARAELSAAEGGLAPLTTLHFRPPGFCHHVTALYPLAPGGGADVAAEAALAPRRAELHAALGLPADRPLLRAANALSFAAGGGNGSGAGGATGGAGVGGRPRLRDVHAGLPRAGVAGGSLHLVQGSYEYCHYGQDRFDDSGWGCAYRSLQTLASWFAAQHYTARAAPPSHREIQNVLVKLGDKEAAFAGSRQWIGAVELGFVLDELLGVQCRVLTVADGAAMAAQGRALAAHFDSQGTPVMVGGGVLAYTLLGVDFCAESGECAFLILDPHYTGGEDLAKIRAGGWCAWKRPGERAAAGGELFVAGAFYNLLCPQRPAEV